MSQNKKQASNSVRVTFRLTPVLKERLNRASVISELKQATIMRNGIRKEVDRILSMAEKDLDTLPS